MLLLLVLGECALAAPKWILFKGIADARYNNTVVYAINASAGLKDSTIIKNGKFIFRHLFIGPCTYIFNNGYMKSPIVLVDRSCVVSLNIHATGIDQLAVQGSQAQKIYAEFVGTCTRFRDSLRKGSVYNLVVIQNNITKAWDTIPQEFDKAAAQFAIHTVLKYPYSYASAYILSRYTKYSTLVDVENAYYHLSQAMQNSDYGLEVKVRLQKLKSTGPGQKVAEFSLLNDSGKEIAFSSVKDKVVLINFWASWCGPCREEFKLLRHVYEKHKDKGFAIISISVDASPGAWKKALQQEQLPWLQLRDETTGVDVSAGRFGVTGLPTIFILNRERKILYRDLRGGVLDKVIEGLVNE